MLKQLAVWIFLPILIVGAVTFGAASIFVRVPSEDHQYCLKAAKDAGDQHPYCPNYESLLQRGLADPVAYYTLWLTIFTGFLAVIGIGQGLLTSQQVRLARDEFIASHRPRLRVRLMKVKDPSVGNPIKIEFTVTNAGDSDAEAIEAEATLSVQPDGVSTTEKFAIASPLAPGEPFVVSREMKEAWQAAWKPGTGAVRINGHISYKDKNGISRRTGFYRFSTPDLNRFRLPGDSDIERDYEFED